MTGGRRPTVLVVEPHADTRELYVEALLAAGYVVHGLATPMEAERAARSTPFDVIVVDTVLDAVGLEIAERLAALRPRPRLVVITSRPRTGAPLEWLFDRYVAKPCLPDALVAVVRAMPLPPARPPDLLIVARDRVGIHDVLLRFGGTTDNVDIRLDRRRRPDRRGGKGRPRQFERRQRDRRAVDVTDHLHTYGWAFVAAIHRR